MAESICPLLVASRSPWKCLSIVIRPRAPSAYSSAGVECSCTSKIPVARSDIAKSYSPQKHESTKKNRFSALAGWNGHWLETAASDRRERGRRGQKVDERTRRHGHRAVGDDARRKDRH